MTLISCFPLVITGTSTCFVGGVQLCYPDQLFSPSYDGDFHGFCKGGLSYFTLINCSPLVIIGVSKGFVGGR